MKSIIFLYSIILSQCLTVYLFPRSTYDKRIKEYTKIVNRLRSITPSHKQNKNTKKDVIENVYPQPYAPYFSQCGQDKYLDQHIFKGKKQGIFVEIGAHDGISYSNTYFFEKDREWSGICIEPHPDKFQQLHKNRNCYCVQACVTDKDGSIPFLKINGPHEMLSGIVSHYNEKHLERIDSCIEQDGGSHTIIDLPAYTLNSILDHHHLTHVDLLCIDVEGGEYPIISSIDFNRYHICYILIENNYNENKIEKYLRKNNYKKITTIDHDDLFQFQGCRKKSKKIR